jgi:hypothetical protein
VKRQLSIVLFAVLCLGLAAPSAFAYPRDPADYAQDMAQWHLVHQRDRKAVSVVLQQFRELPAKLRATKAETGSEESVDAFKLEWFESEALAVLVTAIVFTDGKYALKAGAPSQGAEGRKRTLTLARAYLAAAERTDSPAHEVWQKHQWLVVRRARLALAEGNHRQVVRAVRKAMPQLSETVSAKAPNVNDLSDAERDLLETLAMASLRSEGKYHPSSDDAAPKGDRKNHVKWAVGVAEHAEIRNVTLKADALKAQPAKRSDYIEFVLDTARAGDFDDAAGWKHAQDVFEELAGDAKENLRYQRQQEQEPKPPKEEPENSCG